MTAEIKLEGLVRNLPDELYHKVLPKGEASYSSSQFKDAMNDIEYFHKKYVTQEIKEEHSSTTLNNFAIGHAYHCLTLEKDKFGEQFAIFEGAVKRGKAYDEFVLDNGDKKILTKKQLALAKFIADAADKNEISKELRSHGEAEVSLFTVLHGLKVKVRADWICFEGFTKKDGTWQPPFIMDMKSTTGNPKDAKKIVKKIEDLNYDLSAALYMDAFNEELGSKGLPLIEEWKFCFDSKDSGTSKVYTASAEMLEVGRKKYMEGLNNINTAEENDWNFYDTDTEIGPSPWAKADYLKEDEEDLL